MFNVDESKVKSRIVWNPTPFMKLFAGYINFILIECLK